MVERSLPAAVPNMMTAVTVERFGGIEAMRVASIPTPRPRGGEVLLQVEAAGVGPWDALVRSGKSGVAQTLPLVLGADVAGVVVDPGDSEFVLGDLVFGVTNASFTGAQAEYALAEARRLTRKPAGLSFLEAGAAPVIAVTAASMLFELGELKLGQRVLIHGGAGSVGSLAVQLAKRAGAQVIATAFAVDVSRVKSLGADEVININETPFVGAVKYADLVIDTVGGVTQTASFDVLVPGGRLVSSVSQPDAALATERHVKATWFIVDVTRERLEAVLPFLDDPRTELLIGEVLPLKEVAIAHEMLAGRPHRAGKIVLRVGEIPSELLP